MIVNFLFGGIISFLLVFELLIAGNFLDLLPRAGYTVRLTR